MLTSAIKVRARESDKTAMAVIRRDALVEMCAPHLGPGEDVRECVEASVLEVNGRSDTATDVERVLVAVTGRRILTLAWRGGAEPVFDGAVPLEYLADARVDDTPVGVAITVRLTTGASVRLAVGAAQAASARDFAGALGSDAVASGALGPVTEELPVVTAVTSGEDRSSRVRLAAEIAALCERNRGRILELTPGLLVSATVDGASTYYVHVAPPARATGTCPRCEHPNRQGAVFCDACGALL